MSYTDLNIEISSFFTTAGCYDNEKKFDFLEVRLSGKLCVNFHSVAGKDKSCTIRLWPNLNFPPEPFVIPRKGIVAALGFKAETKTVEGMVG